MQSAWKDLRRTGRKPTEMSQKICSKIPGEFAGHVGRSCRFSSQDFFSWLPVAALCNHTGKCVSWVVRIAQKCFFGAACGKKHCEASILQSDKSFMTWHKFCSCFWLSAFILTDRPPRELGEWLVLASVTNYTRRRIDKYNLVFRPLPCDNKEEKCQEGQERFPKLCCL